MNDPKHLNEAANQATEVAAANIQKYLTAHTTNVQANNMIMHDEQFSRVVDTTTADAQAALQTFLAAQG